MAEDSEPPSKRLRTVLAQNRTTELFKETTNSSSKVSSNDEPSQLTTNLLSTGDIQTVTKPLREPVEAVDVLLLVVKDCEFLACYQELKDPYRCWFDGLGYVYFGEVANESQQENVRAALLRCHESSSGPGGSLISVKTAVPRLRPKAVISTGTCSSLNPDKVKLGDVVVAAKLTTTGSRNNVSKRFLDLIKNCTDGWQPPLKNPKAHTVEVHRDGEILSGPELVSAEKRRKQLAKDHPHAIAIEMEGEGIFTAAFDCQIEWLIVKGIADYADGAEVTKKSWSHFASVVAASLVAHILSDPAVFKSWPHYEDSSEQSSASKSKEDLPAPRDSASEFLEWCQNQLCSFYNSTASQVMITPWDVDNTMDIDEVYVELSIFKDDRKLTGTTKEKLEDYSKVFESHKHHLVPKRILVYGKPGIGKSTFTKKLAVDWSRGRKEILRKFSVLLLIKLRDVCNTPDLCDMLQTAALLSGDDPEVFNKLCKYIQKNQQKVLFVFDGFDEYSAKKSSPVHQIWKGSILRNCTVLVTTRPRKEGELRPQSRAQFEINGFDRERVKQFVSKFLNDQVAIDEFTALLDEHTLWEMVEIPLLLLMVCLTWKKKGREQLEMMSPAHLYESFLQTLFDHAVAKTSDKEFRSIDKYKADLSKLGKLAFDALLTDCLYFKCSKLPEDIGSLIKKYIAVGFFQVSKLSSSVSPEEVVYFLHKTTQEFLSAWFIVQELTNAKNKTPTCLLKVDSFEKIKEIEMVLNFVFQMSSAASIGVFSHLQMIGKKECLTEYNFSENPSIEDLSYNERKFSYFCLTCLRTCLDRLQGQTVYPFYLECVNSVVLIDFSESLHPAALLHHFQSTVPRPSSLFIYDKEDLEREVDDDVFSLMDDLDTVVATCYGDTKPVNKNTDLHYINDFFLKKKGQQMVLYLTKINKLEDKPLQCVKLLSALVSEPESPPQTPVDDVSQNRDARSSLALTEKTSDQTQKHSLSFVRKIKITEPTSEELTIVSNVLSFVRRPQVVFIEQGVNEFCDAQLVESLVSHISFTYSLVELTLDSINLTAKCAAVIARSLHQASNLQELNLSGNPMDSGVRDLAENLHHTEHLQKLMLNDVHMGDQECWLLATSLRHVTKLQVLELSKNPLGHRIIELTRHLHTVPHLTELNLMNTQMGEEEVIAVARTLKSVPELKELCLSNNPLSHGIIELLTYLHTVPHLTELNLMNTQMGEEEVIVVARTLKSVPELKKLCLSNNPLSHGIIELARHLHNVPHLTKLDLENTQMSEEEAIAVAPTLKSVPELKELCLSNNPLGHGIIELATHLHTVPHLTELNLMNTQMGEEEVIAVAHALKYVPELNNLILPDNPLGRGVSALIQHLSSTPLLRTLTLFGVQMTKKEATDLCAAERRWNISLYSNYHVKDNDGEYRLRTEAELDSEGVEFDEE